MTLHPKIQNKLLAEFRAGTCNKCLDYSKIESKCTIVGISSQEYFVDKEFTCPIGEF